MSAPIFIDRPPRIQPELPIDEIEIPPPPDKEEGGIARLIQVGLPLLTIIGYVVVSSMRTGGGGRGLMLIPMALTVVGSTAFSIYSFLRERKRRAQQEKEYADRLIEMHKEMSQSHDQQRRFYRYNYPDIASSMRIKDNARIEAEKALNDRSMRAETRLWERRTSDDDFGYIRLGMGTLPSTVIYKFSDKESTDDPQVRAAKKLEEDSLFVSDTPVVISLRPPQEDEQETEAEAVESYRTPTAHALGIAGHKEPVYEYVRGMLAHFMIFHSPLDTRIYALGTYQKDWAWIESLPHSPSNDQESYSCFVDDIEEVKEAVFGEDDENEIEQFLEQIRKDLAQRQIKLQGRDENEDIGDPTLPLLLVVIDLLDAVHDESSLLYNIESKPAISLLLENGAALGASVIFLVPERSKVPSGCSGVVEIEKTIPPTNSKTDQYERLHFRYSEVGVNSFRYIGEADAVKKQSSMAKLAQDLAPLQIRQGAGANLTSSVPFMTLMGYESMDDLRDKAEENWHLSTDARYANYLRAKIGLMSGNKPRSLVFSAKRDGVHGMVAGSTGSGKSELLISLITALAVQYDPSMVNFVLVDYKGGGAFNDFEDLPHCVDIITNLDGEGVTRMFTAIRAEMNRRSALNADQDAKDIVHYHKKNLHQEYQPYPFLFIIIDEFAEMIADRPEYRSELESITRVGRSLGVSLLLAAQRPSGVTDQMRSNIKFRICLRVETQPESREMLRRIDAAFLPSGVPGRGYLQVGNDEIELFQSAYTGEPYLNTEQVSTENILWPERQLVAIGDQEEEAAPPLYRAIIEQLDVLAQGKPPQLAPWPKALPTTMSLPETLVANNSELKPITSTHYLGEEALDLITLGQVQASSLELHPYLTQWLNGTCGWVEEMNWLKHSARPVVGLIDNPYERSQLPLTIDFNRGHYILFGASGWGKTTLIRSLIVSLCASHSPRHLHAYVLDLGGRNLGVLAALPHVGEVITPDEAGYKERVEQLLRVLDEEVEARKEKLNISTNADINDYNQTHPHDAVPSIVVAIDNFIEFRETFGEEADDVESTLERFTLLARQSRPYNIHFIITAGDLSAIPNQLFSLFTERMTLKLSDPTEYRAIVGGQVADLSEIPGRGYIKIGRQPLTFQIALPITPDSSSAEPPSEETGDTRNETKELQRLADEMLAHIEKTEYSYLEPTEIKALPTGVLYKQLITRIASQDKESKKLGLALDENFLEKLETLTEQKWADSKQKTEADWLNVIIGVISGDRPLPLELEAKKDGVHGLIAGGTGSGKSELLTTLVAGLALNYDPSILNFVLVDYKGGGAFQPFKRLPHCVDIITNLNKGEVRRMFTAINAEMQRRQKLNADCSVPDIVEYRKKGYHLQGKDGDPAVPYPHLFIIIDEYAEMITDTPEFRSELESITRVGRSLGVNLLLASQRPIGVSDQMRANIKLRICLRVEDIATSREMLRRSDAAFLPSGMPGRGYLQVGNENIELTQIAYAGESYENPVDPEKYPALVESDEPPKFYATVVELAHWLSNTLGIEKQRTPWPPSLRHDLTLSTTLEASYIEESEMASITAEADGNPTLNYTIQQWLELEAEWSGIDWENQAMRGVVGLIDDPHRAVQYPLRVDLSRGHAVIFGSPGSGKSTFMRSLVVSLAATHSPGEFHAHILDLGGRNLETLRSLPHVGTVILPDEEGYEERIQQLLRELNTIIDNRKRLFTSTDAGNLTEYNSLEENVERPVIPAILVVIDNFEEYVQTFGDQSGDDEDNPLSVLISLARQGNAYGIHFAVSAQRLNTLSNKLYSLFAERLTLRLADASEYSGIVGNGAGEIDDISGRGFVRVNRRPLHFQVALLPGTVDELGQVSGEARQVRAIGDQMTKYIAHKDLTFEKPLRIDALKAPSYYDALLSAPEVFNLRGNASFLEQLQDTMVEMWAKNESPGEADWLKVILGLRSGNSPRQLVLEAKEDGVHGLVAGGTGSGKSELLMTMIIGLVVNYSPDILNFVLVDYKGGGAFTPFKNLPHCVDIVTNLNKAGVDRMFTSINAEIRRRQALNVETGTKDIVDYRKNGYHLQGKDGKPGRSYPHLFIIIDEYAEMVDDNPEYKAELESITRVGRAQGINLVLASQRPKGVTDQMRANIKFRICLRVEEKDTSRELLGRPDAALLPNKMPGRGYIQIGNDNIELVQVSWTGADQQDDRPLPILWPEHVRDQAGADDDTPKLFDNIVTLASELTDGVMAPKPWPGFLPDEFSLQSQLFDSQKNRSFTLLEDVTDWLNDDIETLWPGMDWQSGVLSAVMGLVDDPVEAIQRPLVFDLSKSHIVTMGDTAMGKTTFVQTMLVSLAAQYSPNDFHAYILDLGGRSYRSFEEFPHVGAVLYSADETFDERLNRLLDKIEGMITERQKEISEAGVTNFAAYNAQKPQTRYPFVVIFIDNFAEMRESYEPLVEDRMVPLARRALGVGITIVATCNIPSNMPTKLYTLFGERTTLKQTNKDRYLDIVGRGAIEIDDIPGRGYIKVGKRPLLFQTALPIGLPGIRADDDPADDSATDANELARIGASMEHAIVEAKHDLYNAPDPLRVLPELVQLSELLEHLEPPVKSIQSVIGLRHNLTAAVVDLKRQGPHFAILGASLSGKTTTLYNLILSLTMQNSPEQVSIILVDMQGKLIDYGGTQRFSELSHCIGCITEVEQLEEFTELVTAEALKLKGSGGNRATFVIVDNYEDLLDEIDNKVERALATLARRHGRDGLHFIIAAADSGHSEIKRRVLSSKYGIVLRSTRLDDLGYTGRAPRHSGPAFPIGRGYLMRSGQPTMVQVAIPYDAANMPNSSDLEDEHHDRMVTQSLDGWIEKIKKKFPQKSTRASVQTPNQERLTGASPTTDQQLSSANQNEKLEKIHALLRGLMVQELSDREGVNGSPNSIVAKYVQIGSSAWNQETELMELIKEAFYRESGAEDLPVEVRDELYPDMTDERFILGLEQLVDIDADFIMSSNGENS